MAEVKTISFENDKILFDFLNKMYQEGCEALMEI